MPFGSYLQLPGLSAETGGSVRAVAGVSIAAGQLVAMANSGGVPRAVLADANGTDSTARPFGGALQAAGIGTEFSIRGSGGEIEVPDAYWDSVPDATNVGDPVYMSETAGNWTLTMPTTTNVMQMQVGLLSRGGTGACKVQVSIQRGLRKQ